MKRTKKLLILMIALIFLLSLSTAVNAAGSYNASATATTLTVGQSTNLNIKTTNAEGKFSITSSNPEVVSVGNGSLWVSSSENITLTAKSAGTANIIIKPISVSDTDLNLITNSKTVKITVKDKNQTPPPANPTTPSNNGGSSSNNNNNNSNTSKKSSDTSLKSITVGGNSYKIGDTMTVSSDTSSINIQAVAKSSKATVSGNGTKELVTGTNKFTIKVTAEDGSTKNYSITVIREEYVEDNPNIVDPNYENQSQELRLSSLTIQGIELTPNFNSEVFEYTAYIINEDKLEIEAISNMEEANVEIIGNTNLVEGENTVTIKLTKDDKTAEYKIIVNKSIVEDKEEQENAKVGFIGSISNWWNNSGSTIVVFTIILVLLGAAAIFAVTSYKYSNNAKETSKHTQSESGYVEDIFSKQEK